MEELAGFIFAYIVCHTDECKGEKKKEGKDHGN